MKTTRRRNSLVVTIPLAAAAAAWVFLVFLPIQRAIGRLGDEENEIRQYCDRSELLLPVLAHTSRDLVDVQERLVRWRQPLPSSGDLTALLGEITASARSAGLRTTRFDPQPMVKYDRIAQMPVEMGVTGSFPRFFAFLRKLETMPRTIWIDRMMIGVAGNGGEDVLCELNLVVFVDNPDISDQGNNSVGR